MNPEDQIRAAFEDLSRRVADEPSRPIPSSGHPSRNRRALPALAAAMGTIVVIGGIALLQILPSDPPITAPAVTSGLVTTTVPDGSPTTVPPSTTPTPQVADDRYRVNAELVAGDSSDPFLNVRVEPDPSAQLLAKLPPQYRGMRVTGAEATAPDGGSWVEVELLHPTPITSGLAPTGGKNPRGWVNSSFIVHLVDGISVGTEYLPPCAGASAAPGSDGTASYVASLEAVRLTENCLRIVVGFGFGTGDFEWMSVTQFLLTEPPVWSELQGPRPLILALPNSTIAWPAAANASDVYVVRLPDLGLGLTSLEAADSVTIRDFEGMLVIDLEGGSQPPPIKDNGVVLTGEPSVGLGSISVAGLARPFEANLGVYIEDLSGTPVSALWSGSSFFGTVRQDSYAVQTNDWTTAWAGFAVRAEGLPNGSYVMVLSPDGGSDQPRALRLPFVVSDSQPASDPPSVQSNEIATALASFAHGGPTPPLAESVMLRLGVSDNTVTLDTPGLADPSNWVVDANEFEGYTGPFDFLSFLRNRPFVSVTDGQVDHCASPPIDYWPAVGLTSPPVNIQPIGIDSCIDWFNLAVRLDDQGQITEIVLDLYGP